ncbi:maleylpyruvate isomerase family mycothiol-dependent enzyme [Gordonia sp. NPDC003585]|uniref:maleylpyruvate isomerase family mycothiol-dependent enzyme n=1 Tax=unclassified Gordonia (in: high G+C Gram-positive bacteria) TaxID=2657482 RepID=UPI0033BA9454
MDEVQAFRAAADHFVALVSEIDDQQWDAPGLGEWDVRALVGHTGRALSTVRDYVAQPSPDVCEILTIADYFDIAAQPGQPAAIAERGRQAGAALGSDPLAAVEQLRADALAVLAETSGDRVVPTAAGSMRLSVYLPTRTFELAVHGLDIARATGQEPELPDEVAADALATASAIAVRKGQAAALLLALCGRTPFDTLSRVV